MKKISGRKSAWLLLLAAFVSLIPCAVKAAVSNDECLGCHEAYKNVNHAGVGCTDCHSTITNLPHEEKLPKPDCRTCHDVTADRYAASAHKKKGLACRDCHNVHYPQKDKRSCASCHTNAQHEGLAAKADHLDRLSCLACHAKTEKAGMEVRLSIGGRKGITPAAIDKNGDGRIDGAEWRALEETLLLSFKGKYKVERAYSVNADPHTVTPRPAACAACHSAGSRFAQARLVVSGPQAFEIAIDPRIFIPELPSAKDYEKTAHGLAGVACADCHTGKGAASSCGRCHADEERTYGASLHAKEGATRCTDCHDPHKVKPYRAKEAKERVAVCARCHTDYLKKHAWLPNRALHFDYLECASCHSPRSQKSIVFFFARKSPAGKTRLTYGQLAHAYGGDPSALLKGKSPDEQIGRLFATLKKRDESLVIDASISVTRPFHDYSEKPAEVRHCVACHSRKARFYDSMFFMLPGPGAADYIPVKGTLLAAYPIARSADFFLLSEDRLRKDELRDFLLLRPLTRSEGIGFKWIDFAGFWLIVLIIAAICVHIILRITVKR